MATPGNNQLFFRYRHEETFQASARSPSNLSNLPPCAFIQNYRHAMVNRLYQPVCLGRDDGEGPVPSCGLRLPRLIEAGK